MFFQQKKKKNPYCLLLVLESKSETLGPGFTSFKIGDLLYGRTYIFSIRPLYGEVTGPVTTVYQRICEYLSTCKKPVCFLCHKYTIRKRLRNQTHVLSLL